MEEKVFGIYDRKKRVIRLLAQMLKQEEDLSTATEALTQTLQNGCHDPDSILTTWYHLTGQIPESVEISVPQLKQILMKNFSYHC